MKMTHRSRARLSATAAARMALPAALLSILGLSDGRGARAQDGQASLPHFQCYEVETESQDRSVSLVDQFGAAEGVVVRQPKRLCAPADKNGEDPDAPTRPEHLTGYDIRHPFLPVQNQEIVNQFGTIVVFPERCASQRKVTAVPCLPPLRQP